jgi:hypothetical protein
VLGLLVGAAQAQTLQDRRAMQDNYQYQQLQALRQLQTQIHGDETQRLIDRAGDRQHNECVMQEIARWGRYSGGCY